jgi:hypothetical protein
MATITRTEALAAFEALSAEDKWWMAENIMSILKGAGPLKPRGRKPKSVSEDGSVEAPKKRSKANLHHILTHVVKPALNTAAEAEADAKVARLMKKGRAQKAVAQVFVEHFSDLETEAAATAVAALTPEDVMAVFKEWSTTPEANKPRKSRSTASSGSDSKSKKTKLADMTEEEKKAFYKARGEAAAAARAAKKAAAESESESEDEAPKKTEAPKNAEKSKPAPEPESDDESDAESDAESVASDSDDEEPVAVKPYAWEHAMEGKESKKYERADADGKAYLFHYKTKEYLGVWDEEKNKINKRAPCPFA